MENVWLISALWIGLALVSALISIRVGISVALIEIIVGSLAVIFSGSRPMIGSAIWRAWARSCSPSSPAPSSTPS